MKQNLTTTGSVSRRSASVVRRLSAGVFLFFFLKGIAWLIVPAALAWWAAQ